MFESFPEELRPIAEDRNFSDSVAQLCAHRACVIASNTVGVCSTARRKRNQEASGMRLAVRNGMSPKSTATMPNPPLCSSKSVTRSDCSTANADLGLRRSGLAPGGSNAEGEFGY